MSSTLKANPSEKQIKAKKKNRTALYDENEKTTDNISLSKSKSKVEKHKMLIYPRHSVSKPSHNVQQSLVKRCNQVIAAYERKKEIQTK